MAEEKKIPDAEFEEEKSSPSPQAPAQRVDVIYPDSAAKAPAPAENPIKIRVETRSRHRLEARIFEVDEDGVIDIIILDAETN